MTNNINGIFVETINNDKTSKTISNIANEILTPFGLSNDKFIYAETICWLREKLQVDAVLSGQKYYVLSETATVEDLFRVIGTEVPVAKFAMININFPKIDLSGIYYDMNGNFIKTEGNENEWNAVFLKDCDNLKYIATLKDFEVMTAALYGETDERNYTLEEMQAIGDVIMNRAELLGTTATEEIKTPNQVNGYYDNDSQGVIFRGRISNSNSRLKTARKATITTILGISRGKSNGAYWWDGADIKSNMHNKEWGIHYTAPEHDIYGTGDNTVGPFQEHWQPSGKNRGSPWDHKLDSTAAYGGTVFWKKNSNYQDVTNKKAYP